MPNPTAIRKPPLPAPALFDVTTSPPTADGTIERVAIDDLELAPNARRDLSQEGIASPRMLMRTGQLVPCIGRRPDADRHGRALRRAASPARREGQPRARRRRRVRGARQPVQSLIVLLLDHHPAPGRGPSHPGAGPTRARTSASSTSRPVRATAGRRAPASRPRPDRRRVRRPRHLREGLTTCAAS